METDSEYTSSYANEVSVFILSLFVKVDKLQVLPSVHKCTSRAHVVSSFISPDCVFF